MALIRIIEGEIIPRLFLAHRNRMPRTVSGPNVPPGDNDVFAQLCLRGDSAEIASRIQGLLHGGMRRDRLYADVLAPASRTLARFWEDGRCTFEDMANALACIDRVLQALDSDRTPRVY